MQKRIVCLGITFIMFFSLTGCNPGLEIGNFRNFKGIESYPLTMGIKSETRRFEIDDIKLELYYGYFEGTNPAMGKSLFGFDDIQHIGFAVFIDYYSNIAMQTYTVKTDYRDVHGLYYVGEVSVSDFVANYKVRYKDDAGRRLSRIEYNHSETISIPRCALVEDADGVGGSFRIILTAILYSPTAGGYVFSYDLEKYFCMFISLGVTHRYEGSGIIRLGS